MVAAPGKDANGAKGPMHTEASKGATPMVGRSKAYKRWRHVILDNLADLGFNSFEDAMDFSPPSQDALTQLAGDGLDTRAKHANVDELFAQALEEYQEVNTRIYNIVHPTLIFDGPHEEEDLETVRKFRKGAIKNGVGLLQWALQWTKTDTFEVQTHLREQLAKAKVPSNPNCLTLYQFLSSLLDVWANIANNSVDDAASLDQFYVVLQQKLPSKLEAGPVSLVRQWLVSKKIEKNVILSEPKEAITTMVQYAKEQGMPSGGYGDELKYGFDDSSSSPTMMIIEGDGKGAGRGNDKPKYGPETNACSRCDSFFCFPKNRDSACGKCICDPKSTFDPKKKDYGIAAGGRRYVYVARAWNKLNPGKKLKGQATHPCHPPLPPTRGGKSSRWGTSGEAGDGEGEGEGRGTGSPLHLQHHIHSNKSNSIRR